MPILLEWAEARIRQGYAPIILIVGKMRVGKTCTGLLLASCLDKNFKVEDQMFFDIISYARAVARYRNKVLVLDEAGIELDSYRYSDVRQRCFSHIVQSQAYRQNVLFIVLPHSSDLARCHRKHVDALIVVPARTCYIMYKPSVPYWNMNDIDFHTKKIEFVNRIPLPPKHLFNAYKTQYESQIKEDILTKELEKMDRVITKETKSSFVIENTNLPSQ